MMNPDASWNSDAITSSQAPVAAQVVDRVANVTEWCKREKCWDDLLQSVEIRLESDLDKDLIDADEKEGAKRAARREQKVLNDIEAQTYVVGRGAPYWSKLHKWASEGVVMTPGEMDFLGVAASMTSRKIPTGPQSQRVIAAEKKALIEGFKN